MQAVKEPGKRIFSFAVIADSHLNRDEMGCNSPFPVNKLANRRMRHVIRDLNRRDIEFVVHLGDLIHPVPAVKELYAGAAQCFHNQVKELKVPLYVTPGNHDIGDKPMPWAPAGVITEEYIRLWQETFGPQYYSFDRHGVHMVVLNAQLMNSGLPAEAAQMRWLEADLKAHAGERIFICTHYPPFVCDADEPEHYDNMAEPERGRLLRLMARYNVEGLFAGHVHNFWYLREGGARHYLLPSTAFVRQDYSEMFKAPPALEPTEAGRNDTAKLGYFVVHIHENGHVCQMVRTYGACAAPDEPPQRLPDAVEPVAPALNRYASLGFDLRRSWAEKIGIPPSGALDEFDRKEVRNDYPLLGLWEMGVRRLRIPLQDLRNPHTRARMRDMLPLGHGFTLSTYNLLTPRDRRLILENAALLQGWEMGFRWEDLEDLARSLRQLRRNTNLPLYLSPLWEPEDNRSPDGRYYHVINHGFTINDAERIGRIADLPGLGPTGFVFRVMDHDSVREAAAFAGKTCLSRKLPVNLHLRLAGFNPALPAQDDCRVARRAAEALFCTAGTDITVFADTLTDIDRGYFVRNGVLDQICNPRPAARVISHLSAALNEGAGGISDATELKNADGRWLRAEQGGGVIALFLPEPGRAARALRLPPEIFPAPERATAVDLDSGFKFPATEIRLSPVSRSLYFLKSGDRPQPPKAGAATALS